MKRNFLTVGGTALALCVLGAFWNPAQFFRSYLLGYLFWLGIALGCLPLTALHNLSGGAWGLVIRRALQSGLATLPLLAVLFLPLVLGLGHIYVWARPEVVAGDAILQHKSAYLNVPFFLVRAAVYFAVWIAVARTLVAWAIGDDVPSEDPAARRLRQLSGPALALYGATMTFASIDWAMSLEPHWSSTMYGVLFTGGQILAALAFVIAVTVLLAARAELVEAVAPGHWQDLGNLLLAFVMLWAYFAFSQYLIIWSGNLPEEIPWYLHRLAHGWFAIAIALIVFHFALPFLLLLSRGVKRRAVHLGMVAGAVVCMRFIDLFWMIVPEFTSEGPRVHWMDVAAPIGLGGIWLAAFLWQLGRQPLLPRGLEHAAH
jgi:hypothetical protein